MRTFICGLHPRGAASQSGLGVGDLLVRVGEVTVWDRCHLNVTTIIKNLSSQESVSVTVLRSSSHLGSLSVRPVTHYPLLLDDMVSAVIVYKHKSVFLPFRFSRAMSSPNLPLDERLESTRVRPGWAS